MFWHGGRQAIMCDGSIRIGDLVGAIMARRGYSQLTAQVELERAWHEAAGDKVHNHTRVGALRHGTLEILVDNPALLSELEGFEKQNLLDKLRANVRHTAIRALKFRRL